MANFVVLNKQKSEFQLINSEKLMSRNFKTPKEIRKK